jgi:RNA polymerase sigma-70 factor (ECF subfamily)
MTHNDVLGLYDAHARDLVGWFARRCGDPQLAVDLLGETFLAAVANRRRCRASEPRGRAAWLYRIAANQLADHFRDHAGEQAAVRRLGNELRAIDGSERDAIERLARSDEVADRVAAAFEQLQGDQKVAVALRVIEEQSYAEVSQRLGVSEQTVRARVSRGLRAMRGAIDEQNEESR